jgi:hypothetical protein
MRKLVLVAALVLMAGGAQASTLNVIGGQLHGASNVLVDGSLYDVQFLDCTSIELYTGCDEASDFTFQTEASAILASQALRDQVFDDWSPSAFQTNPALTNGCQPASVTCFVASLIPSIPTSGSFVPYAILVDTEFGYWASEEGHLVYAK